MFNIPSLSLDFPQEYQTACVSGINLPVIRYLVAFAIYLIIHVYLQERCCPHSHHIVVTIDSDARAHHSLSLSNSLLIELSDVNDLVVLNGDPLREEEIP